MLPDTYEFFAIFMYEDDGIHIIFPDLPGCVSFGKDMKEAIYNAKEVLMLHLYGMEKDSDPIPPPSLSLSAIRNDELARDALDNSDSSLVLIQVFMPPYRDSADKHFDKKTLSIPHWINKAAESVGINFSQTLQEALIQKLKAAGIERH